MSCIRELINSDTRLLKQVTCVRVYCSFCPSQGEKTFSLSDQISIYSLQRHVKPCQIVSAQSALWSLDLNRHQALTWRLPIQWCCRASWHLLSSLPHLNSANSTQSRAELFQRMKTRCVLRQVHCTAMSQGETSSLVGVKVGKRWMFPLFHLQNRVTLLASQRALSLNICMFSLKKANAIIFMNSGCNTVQWCEARWITQDLMDAFYQNYVLMQPHILLGLRQEEHPA